jgi:hypothetical protein
VKIKPIRKTINLLFQSVPAIHVQTCGLIVHQYCSIESSSQDTKRLHCETSPNALPFHFPIPCFRISGIINIFLLL